MFSQEKYLKALNFVTGVYGSENIEYIVCLCSVAIEVIHGTIESKMDDDKADISITCAFLHDIMEKKDCSFDDIFNNFGLQIAEGVEALNKNKQLPLKEQTQDLLNRILEQPYEIQMVKLAHKIVTLQQPSKVEKSIKKDECLREAKLMLSCLKNSNLYLSFRLEKKIKEYSQYLN